MPLFKCEECGCSENSALGQFWARNSNVYPPPYDGKKLCSQHGSPFFLDGSPTKFGKWHGKFKQKPFE